MWGKVNRRNVKIEELMTERTIGRLKDEVEVEGRNRKYGREIIWGGKVDVTRGKQTSTSK